MRLRPQSSARERAGPDAALRSTEGATQRRPRSPRPVRRYRQRRRSSDPGTARLPRGPSASGPGTALRREDGRDGSVPSRPLTAARPAPLTARCSHRPPAPARPSRTAREQPRSAMARRGPAPLALGAGGRAGPPRGTAGAVKSVSSARLNSADASLKRWKLRHGQALPRLEVLSSSAQVRGLPAPGHGSPAVGVCAPSPSLPRTLFSQPLVAIRSRGFLPVTEHARSYPLETD